MSSPTSSSSAASESSRSSSPDTGATTPSSVFGGSSILSLPSIYVYFVGTSFTASTLEETFKKHASDNCMGVIIDQNSVDRDSQFFSCKGEWMPLSTSNGNGGSTLNYFSTTVKLEDHVLPTTAFVYTNPSRANEENIFSLCGLRSIFSVPLTTFSTLHVLEKSAFVYRPLSYTTTNSLAASLDGKYGNIPTVEEWKILWATWDLITLQMTPKTMVHDKPIDLRHKCLFYFGHIPTFLDMLLHKSIGGGATEPAYFWNIFERGIDPHVDDPDHCHNHSEVPVNDEDWPTLDSVVAFSGAVRRRLVTLYHELATGKRALTRNIARTLVMTHEHEGWHVETLLYILIQRAGTGTLPPPGFTVPPWEDLIYQWSMIPPPSTQTVIVGPAALVLGHYDSEADDQNPLYSHDVQGHTFGWDNESPERHVHVGAFKAEWRPISNHEFQQFWLGEGKHLGVEMPKSWVVEDDVVKVRTLYGPVSMEIAAQWPVLASYDDLVLFAASKGGRLPTEPELRLFIDLYDVGHEGGANIGFRNWHPVPATAGLDQFSGRGSNGGVWEWTTTVFDNHEGLVPTKLFTGYSDDFFDTKHQVALGASYATIPRLGRRTIRNFYQHNYPYPWIGARVVYDV